MGQVQVPAVLGASDDPTAALVGSITCLAAAVGYCIYSVVYPERQQRLIDAARKKRFRQYAVKVGGLLGGGTGVGGVEGGMAGWEEAATQEALPPVRRQCCAGNLARNCGGSAQTLTRNCVAVPPLPCPWCPAQALTLQTSDSLKYGGLIDANGSLNIKAADTLFDEFDTDKR